MFQITANFRSRAPILAHVNRRFDGPLSLPASRATCRFYRQGLDENGDGLPPVARLKVDVRACRGPRMRDVEAEAVADALRATGRHLQVAKRRQRHPVASHVPGASRCSPRPAPTLALRARAGSSEQSRSRPRPARAFSVGRRSRTCSPWPASRRCADTLAFGALLRGPLVGLTEEELLDITACAPRRQITRRASAFFTVRTALDAVAHPAAQRMFLRYCENCARRRRRPLPRCCSRRRLERLAGAADPRRAGSDRSARSAENVDVFIERARAYGVRGLRGFARDVTCDWKDGAPAKEGRVDADRRRRRDRDDPQRQGP